ncbi:conserved Plasmodium protein, unknown function [Plasmodium malariae]|uniref:Uncharacterized protein n=1 Tax=Plasmodium malariae TaxID=5858 RepID=A0A1C3KZ26_PLAMA|nr:conserved Plasmodium protein, unknown function [Plasmodium malariae]
MKQFNPSCSTQYEITSSSKENNKLTNCVISEIFKLELKDILKNLSNEKEINDSIDFVNDKINTLCNFINKTAKEKYEYFYKYIDRLRNAQNTKKWNTYDLANIEKKYNANYEELRKKKKQVLSLINQKRCLIEIEKIVRLYEITDIEIKNLCDEIKSNKHLDLFNFGKIDSDMEKVGNSSNNNMSNNSQNSIDHNNININGGEYFEMSDTDGHTNASFNLNFSLFVKYIKRLTNLRNFIVYHNIQNISLFDLSLKKIKLYESYIINICVSYLSNSFLEDENYENKVKHCLNVFSYLNMEKDCLKKILINKINRVTLYISNIKKQNRNVRKCFFLILQYCKNSIDQISYINEIIKDNYYMEEIIKIEKEKEKTFDHSSYSSYTNDSFNEGKKCNTIHIYSEFYVPYMNVLINNKVNKFIKKEDVLYVLNLIEEFLHIIRNKNDFKVHEKDLLQNLFSKEYEEITFNSINKLVNLVEMLFQKTNIRNNIEYEHDYNFPTIFDIKNYVDVFYKELFTHIFYPYVFRKIIVSCNNSLLLLSNNLNNLKQNINVHIEIDKKNKYITFDLNHKSFKYNLELFLISRQLLRYLIYNLAQLKRKIREIKSCTMKVRAVQAINGKYEISNFLLNKARDEIEDEDENMRGNELLSQTNYSDNYLIMLSFKESYDDFFNFQDYLNNYFSDNLLYIEEEENKEKKRMENHEMRKKKEKERITDVRTNITTKLKVEIEQNAANLPKDKSNHEDENEKEDKYEDEAKKLANFEINFISDVKHNSFNMNDFYTIFDEEENYEITSFFIKERNKKKKKNFFDLIELEKGVCELNNVVNSCIYEYFESFEKKVISYFKDNLEMLSTDDVHSLFDQLCVYFNDNIIHCIPLYECTQMINNLINRIIIYLITFSSYYSINQMDIYLFKYYESLQKIAFNIAGTSLNFDYKLCTLFKKSVDIKNGKEVYEDIPPFFLAITFVILQGGKVIVDHMNITEEKFINLLIDHLKNPIQETGNKVSNSQNLNIILNKYAKNMLNKKDNSAKPR